MIAPCTVVLADDHPAFLLGVRLGLQAEQIEVVGTAADGFETIDACRRHRPDAAVVDVRMPGMDGLQALATVHRELPATALIVLSTYEDPMTRNLAKAAGARAFLTKDVAIDRLAVTIRRLVSEPRLSLIEAPPLPPLTPREVDVLKLMAVGWSNKGIADELGISPETVKEYGSSLFSKLGVTGRVHAVARGRELGLVP